MTTDPFRSFDPTRYLSVSNLPLQTIVTLSKALESAMPEDAPAHVEALMGRVHDASAESEAAMIIRLREDNEGGASADQLLDVAVDPLWSLLRRRLDDWSAYLREGLDFLEGDDEAPPEVDIEELRERATRARRISERLFGADGLNFVQRPYAEQAQLMANVLGLIETDELGEEIIELTGPELLPMLRRCQSRYEQMVQTRSTRLNGSAANLQTLRARLRRLIPRYAGAVITMLDEDEPESQGVVEAALLPMLTIRPVSARGGALEVVESEIETEIVAAVVDEEAVELGDELGEVG